MCLLKGLDAGGRSIQARRFHPRIAQPRLEADSIGADHCQGRRRTRPQPAAQTTDPPTQRRIAWLEVQSQEKPNVADRLDQFAARGRRYAIVISRVLWKSSDIKSKLLGDQLSQARNPATRSGNGDRDRRPLLLGQREPQRLAQLDNVALEDRLHERHDVAPSQLELLMDDLVAAGNAMLVKNPPGRAIVQLDRLVLL